MKKLVEILYRCEQILKSAHAPKSDLRVLSDFIEKLESSKDFSANNFNNILPVILEKKGFRHVGTAPKARISKPKTSIGNLSNIYKNLSNAKELDSLESEFIKVFEEKHPNIRELLFTEIAGLYDKVSHIGDRTWSLEELQLILLFRFDIRMPQNTPKSSLLGILKRNIYNYDYMDSMKKKYEGE